MNTIITKAVAACAIAGSLAGGAGATVTSEPEEARIPFASNVRDFRADGTDGIYIQDIHRNWYRGTFMSPCLDLPFANAIGFDDRGTGGLDKWGTIYVRGDRCTLRTFVKSGRPPKKLHKPKAKPGKAAPAT